MGVRTCFGGKMSHLACVFVHEGIGGNMVEMLLFTKHFLEEEHGDEEKTHYIRFIRVNDMHHPICSIYTIT